MIGRRTFIVGTAAVAGVGFTGTAHASPNGAGPIWEEFTETPYAHPQIPNVAHAGYRGGETPPRPAVTANVLRYGAAKDGSADAAGAINEAIEDVGRAGGGVVLLPAGTYRIDDVIRIGYDDVVLRGVGSGSTTLRPTRHLTDIIGEHRSQHGGDSNAWCWTGGLVWICHRDRYADLIDQIQRTTVSPERWTGDTVVTEISEPAEQGDFTLRVADPAALRVGQRVLLRLDDNGDHSLLRHMCGEVEGTFSYPWEDMDRLLGSLPYIWPVQIAGIDGDLVELAQPLPLDVRPEWEPTFTTTGPVVTGVGVEGITIEMPEAEQAVHLQDPGHNGVIFQCAWDCWGDDLVVHDGDNGFVFTCAKNVTLTRTVVSGRARHHSYICREQSHDNVVDDFVIDEATTELTDGAIHHGINVEGLASGNVWSNGRMDNGTFDSHRGLPFGNVRTDIVVNNDGRHGGAAEQGPLLGARFAHWNVTVTNGRAGCIRIDEIAPRSATVGISEVSDFDQIPGPDFTGDLESRLESYGTPGITPGNLYHAQCDHLR